MSQFEFDCILLKPGLLQPCFHVAGKSLPLYSLALRSHFPGVSDSGASTKGGLAEERKEEEEMARLDHLVNVDIPQLINKAGRRPAASGIT